MWISVEGHVELTFILLTRTHEDQRVSGYLYRISYIQVTSKLNSGGFKTLQKAVQRVSQPSLLLTSLYFLFNFLSSDKQTFIKNCVSSSHLAALRNTVCFFDIHFVTSLVPNGNSGTVRSYFVHCVCVCTEKSRAFSWARKKETVNVTFP